MKNRTADDLKRESAAKHAEMLHDAVPHLVIKLSLPTVASQLISVIYNTADTYFVAKIHTSAAAAVGVVFALMSIIHAFGFSIGMGANSIISRQLGAHKDEEACQCGSSALFAAFVSGSLLLIIGECTLEPLLRLLGSTDTILPYAKDYTFYILLGAPVMCCTFVLNNILRSEGETQFAMWGICSGGLLNVLLDPLFIFTFNWGIAGAAIATIVSQIVSFLILFSFFWRGRSIVQLGIRRIIFRPGIYWQIFSSGLPTICRQGLGSISSAVLNVIAAGYGDAAVAAISICNKIYMLVRHIVLGVGQGMQPAAGYNYGAGDFTRVRKIFVFTTILGTAISTTAAFIVAPFATGIISLFSSDPEVISTGRIALWYSSLIMPLMAYSTYVNQLSQCLGFRVGATLLASCRQGIFFFPSAVLPYLFKIPGLAAMQPVADFCTFLVSIPYQIHFFKCHLKTK